MECFVSQATHMSEPVHLPAQLSVCVGLGIVLIVIMTHIGTVIGTITVAVAVAWETCRIEVLRGFLFDGLPVLDEPVATGRQEVAALHVGAYHLNEVSCPTTRMQTHPHGHRGQPWELV